MDREDQLTAASIILLFVVMLNTWDYRSLASLAAIALLGTALYLRNRPTTRLKNPRKGGKS